VISREQMFEPLLKADPSFIGAWNDFLTEWKGKPDLPIYVALSELGRHLISNLAAGDTSRFPAIFGVIEQWHTQGDAYVKEAATIGLLENLQNTGVHDTTSPDQFLPWLGPQSMRWWNKVKTFWRDGTIIRDD